MRYKRNLIGKYLMNNDKLFFKILEETGHDSKNIYYKVEFAITKYQTIVTRSQALAGNVKDRFHPSVAGTGYLGNISASKRDRYYSVWHNMINRCYNHNSTEYIHYGKLGVTVCDRWKCFEYFRKDLPKVDGYDETKFLNGDIYLDKDMKQINMNYNDRVYSLETCTFVNASKNCSLTKKAYGFMAISPNGEIYNIKRGEITLSDFCKMNNINVKYAYNVINNFQKSCNGGWIFKKQ